MNEDDTSMAKIIRTTAMGQLNRSKFMAEMTLADNPK